MNFNFAEPEIRIKVSAHYTLADIERRLAELQSRTDPEAAEERAFLHRLKLKKFK